MRTISLITFLALGSCGRAVNKSFWEDYNGKAQTAFVKSYDPNWFQPMSDGEKCVLYHAISSKLDALNNSKLVIVDSFYIRNYYFRDMRVEFSFVAGNQGEFHLIYLPLLWDFLGTDKYYEYDEKSGMIRLPDSVENSVIMINSSLFERFLETEVHHSIDVKSQYQLVSKMLPEILPVLRCPITLEEFRTRMSRKTKVRSEFIMNKLKPLMDDEEREFEFQIFSCDPFGVFFINYFTTPQSPKKLQLDILFIPEEYSYILFTENLKRKYRYCFEK